MRGRWLPWALLAAWLVLAGISAPAGQKIREEVNDEYELPGRLAVGRDRARPPRRASPAATSGRRSSSTPPRRAHRGRPRAIRATPQEAARIEHVARPVPPFTPRSPAGPRLRATATVASRSSRSSPARSSTSRRTIDAMRGDRQRERRPGAARDRLPGDRRPTTTARSRRPTSSCSGRRSLLVLVLLIAVYRSPLLALVPLIVVGVAYMVASGIIYLLQPTSRAWRSTARRPRCSSC